jgi:hypothetical protein
MANMYRRWFRVLVGLLFSSTISFVSTINSNAQSPAPQSSGATPQERTALVQSFATEKLSSWQKRLNLEDWKISIHVARASELKKRTLGNIHWDTDQKTAIIHVLDPADYKLPFPDVLADIEFTLVHELIHLELAPVLAPLQRNDANRREEEHAVNHMTEALLHLERDGKK